MNELEYLKYNMSNRGVPSEYIVGTVNLLYNNAFNSTDKNLENDFVSAGYRNIFEEYSNQFYSITKYDLANQFTSTNVTTILNDYSNMSLLYGFDDPSYFTTDGSNNIVSPFVKDRSISDVTFIKTGTIPYDSTLKAITQTSSGFLTHTQAPFLKGNTLVAMAFRHSYDFSTWVGTQPTIQLLMKDSGQYFGFTEALTYTDTTFNALVNLTTKGRTIYEIGGHTILMLYSDGTTLYYYVNNVLKSSHTYTGTASDVRLTTGIMPAATQYPASTYLKLHEMRIYNKIYTDIDRTLLYNDLVSRYALDVINYPTVSNLSIVGTVSAGSTVTLSYTYNQNSAGTAGDFYVISGYYSSNLISTGVERAWKYLLGGTGKKNDLTMTVPSVTTGYYFHAFVIVYDIEGRTSKVMYGISSIIS